METGYEILVWAGTALTLAGLGLLILCIVQVARVRRRGLDEAGLRAALQRIVPVNLGALFLSVLGLMMVVIGVILS